MKNHVAKIVYGSSNRWRAWWHVDAGDNLVGVNSQWRK